MAGRVAIAAVLALIALAGCGDSDERSASSPGKVVDLTGPDDLRNAFVADEGRAKLLLVLSPT